jgi:hypothetical protein
MGIAKMPAMMKSEDRGRPRLEVDFALILRLRDEQHLGWSKMAQEYRRITGQYISKETMKRRYYEAKDRK